MVWMLSLLLSGYVLLRAGSEEAVEYYGFLSLEFNDPILQLEKSNSGLFCIIFNTDPPLVLTAISSSIF